MGGCTFKRKAPFATTSFKKGVGVFLRVGLFSGVGLDYGTIQCQLSAWLPHLRKEVAQACCAQHSIYFEDTSTGEVTSKEVAAIV